MSDLDNLKKEVMVIHTNLVLMSFDVAQMRKQLDNIESMLQVLTMPESTSILPNTPPPNFIPPEMM